MYFSRERDIPQTRPYELSRFEPAVDLGCFLALIGGGLHLFEDARQEARVRLWENRERVEGADHPERYAQRLARNTALNMARGDGRYRERVCVDLDELVQGEAEELGQDAEQEEYWRRDVLTKLFSRLTETQRRTFVGAREEKTQAEIATELGVSAPAISQQMKRIRSVLLELMHEYRPEDDPDGTGGGRARQAPPKNGAGGSSASGNGRPVAGAEAAVRFIRHLLRLPAFLEIRTSQGTAVRPMRLFVSHCLDDERTGFLVKEGVTGSNPPAEIEDVARRPRISAQEKFERTKPHVIVGHVDHGKTTLTAAIMLVLQESGCAVVDKIDKAPEEWERWVTVATCGHWSEFAAAPAPWPDNVVAVDRVDDEELLDLVELEIRELLDPGNAGGNVGPQLRGVRIADHRPRFYFRTTDMTGAAALPAGTEMVMPGDNVKPAVVLMAPDAVEKGVRFAIRGGETGSGTHNTVSKLKKREDSWAEMIRDPERLESGAAAERDVRETILTVRVALGGEAFCLISPYNSQLVTKFVEKVKPMVEAVGFVDEVMVYDHAQPAEESDAWTEENINLYYWIVQAGSSTAAGPDGSETVH